MPVKSVKKDSYIGAVGKRKTSVARVRITKSTRPQMDINGKSLEEYFRNEKQQMTISDILSAPETVLAFKITVRLRGGGISSQAEALRHGIARALVKYDPELRSLLKQRGYLKRDPRMKERRKFGLKKARKAPQWSKR